MRVVSDENGVRLYGEESWTSVFLHRLKEADEWRVSNKPIIAELIAEHPVYVENLLPKKPEMYCGPRYQNTVQRSSYLGARSAFATKLRRHFDGGPV